MRKNNPLMIIVLVLVLLLGAGVGIWIVLSPGDESGKMQVSGLDDGESDDTDKGDPLTDSAANEPGKTGNGDTADRSPGENPDTTNKHNPGDSTRENPDNPPGDSEPRYVEYVTTSTIHGRVSMKSDGRSAVGASIRVETNTNQMNWGGPAEAAPADVGVTDSKRPKPELSGEATTDGAGEYSLTVTYKSWHAATEGLPEGVPDESQGRQHDRDPIIVVASLPGYAPARSNHISVGIDSDHEVNLRLSIPAAITGRVIDAMTREGISGANGLMQDADAWRDGGSAPYAFTSDANGYFSLNALPASSYTISVNATGYAEYGGWEKGRVNLSGGGEKDLGEIALLRSASVIGRVVDESATPLAGADVQLLENQPWGGRPRQTVQTGEDGRFTMTDVEPGTYTLKVSATGKGAFNKDGVTIEAAGQTDLGEIVLGEGLEVSGVVVGPDNEPMQGVLVGLSEVMRGMLFQGAGEPGITSTTDAEGRFTLSGLSEGKHELSAVFENLAPHRETLNLKQSVTGLKIKLSVGGSISGKVIDSDGNPVGEVNVSATSQDSENYSTWKSMPNIMFGAMFARQDLSATTDSSGNFTITNVPEDTYLLAAASATGGAGYLDDVSVKDEAETANMVIRFPGKGAARISVTENGAAVQDLRVSLTQNIGFTGAGMHSASTDSTGTALIENVSAGTWYVVTQRDEGSWDTDSSGRRLVIREGETVEFALELRPKEGVRLHGRLTLNGKAVFEDAMLIGTGSRSDVMKNAKLVEGGFYEFVGLKTGTYVLHTRTSDTDITAKVSLNLDREGDFPFDKDFVGYTISGTVSTPENTPAQLSSVSVAIQHASNERPEISGWLRGRTSTGADGAFAMNGVTPGKYVLTASLDGVGSVSTTVTISSSDQTGLKLEITQNSGKIKVTVGKLTGTPVAGSGFGMVALTQTDGSPVDLGESFQGWFMLSEGATQTIPTVQPGTYHLHVTGSGYIGVKIVDVSVQTGETTEVETDMTAAAELHVTFTNTEITQAMLNTAVVKYRDATGAEVPVESNMFDSFGAPAPPEVPTLIAKYLNQKVTEVHVKIAGYAEFVIPVEFQPGKKISKEESLAAE